MCVCACVCVLWLCAFVCKFYYHRESLPIIPPSLRPTIVRTKCECERESEHDQELRAASPMLGTRLESSEDACVSILVADSRSRSHSRSGNRFRPNVPPHIHIGIPFSAGGFIFTSFRITSREKGRLDRLRTVKASFCFPRIL